ncbi:interleukin-1 receptor-associated kinase-like 2 [Pseudophryne corroboree]|uniref:interleukin-1 receptor-associated kinase-like 2 n=1 Tax=Pseudophryne corroboree TaxID=495146 RepID=UPI003081CF0D
MTSPWQSSSSSSSLIIDIPPRVLDEFCRCVDCLNDWEWLRFASLTMNDQTTIQRFWMKRKGGDGVTREVLWSWGQKLATVQDLEAILHHLELYRALHILRQCSNSSGKVPLAEERRTGQRSAAEESCRNSHCSTEKVSAFDAQSLPSPPPPPADLLKTLHIDSDADQVSRTDQALSIPQQEISLTPGTACQHWTLQQLNQATDKFSTDRKIHSGQFADVFVGRKADTVYAIKRLKEPDSEQTDGLHSFFHTEAQISFRCKHHNLLPLLGFCLENKHFCLIHQFMKNGSLDTALQEAGSHTLSWEKRLRIATGLLQAVHHLHESGIFHGNIRSSNVLLDEDLSPKLGHSRPSLCTDRSASYTQMKTCELQRYQPYLSDSFLRSGQLTAHTDIFSSGVVLAEILTGLKACDKSRDPAYLKDLVFLEMEQAKMWVEARSNKMESAEFVCAKEISTKYVDTRPGKLQRGATFYLASAVCLCLTKKRVQLSEVLVMVEKAEDAFRTPIKEPQVEMTSMNIPEESDESLSLGYAEGEAAEQPISSSNARRVLDCTSIPGTKHYPAASEVSNRSPCELDESGNYLLSPGGSWYDQGSEPTSSQPSTTGHQADSCVARPHLPEQNTSCECPETSHSPTESGDPSWGIKVNKSKMKLMEDIELYEEEKVDSSVFFGSAQD